jgi:hypothetical protein
MFVAAIGIVNMRAGEKKAAAVGRGDSTLA